MTTSFHKENFVSNFIQTLERKFWWSTSRAGFCNFSKWFCEFVWAPVVFVPTLDCFYKHICQLIWPFRVLFYSHGNWGILHKLFYFLCCALTQPVHELLNYLNSRGLFSQLYLILTQFNQMWACGIMQSKWWPSSEPFTVPPLKMAMQPDSTVYAGIINLLPNISWPNDAKGWKIYHCTLAFAVNK